MREMEITIAHLYPDLLNLYGDRGNIITLRRRLQLRGIEAQVNEYELRDDIDFAAADIIFIGGGSDREQKLVCSRLRDFRNEIADFAESGGSILAVCGGYQLLGKYYKLDDETIAGTELLDIYTEQKPGRLIGNIVLDSEIISSTVVGFENHGGRTYTGNYATLGTVKYGSGNNAEDGKEGVVYKNVIGTYLHGPLLPKNPKLADYIISNALERKYGKKIALSPLDDEAENKAHDYVVKRFCTD